MTSDDWQPMETAPLNPCGKAYGPTVLIWCDADALPWPAFYHPAHDWKHRDVGPAWVIPDQEPAIAPEDAVAWAWITPPKGEEGSAGVKQSLTVAEPEPDPDAMLRDPDVQAAAAKLWEGP